ncbi:MAG: hypothetical protein AAFR33_07370 [Pseudomonadota bacterium]
MTTRFSFANSNFVSQAWTNGTTAGSLTITPSSANHVIVPFWFRIVEQHTTGAAIHAPDVYIERYDWGDTPGQDSAVISVWTPLRPFGVAHTSLGLFNGATHWEWENNAPLEVAAVDGSPIKGSALHVRFASKASAVNQYIACNYGDLLAEATY